VGYGVWHEGVVKVILGCSNWLLYGHKGTAKILLERGEANSDRPVESNETRLWRPQGKHMSDLWRCYWDGAALIPALQTIFPIHSRTVGYQNAGYRKLVCGSYQDTCGRKGASLDATDLSGETVLPAILQNR